MSFVKVVQFFDTINKPGLGQLKDHKGHCFSDFLLYKEANIVHKKFRICFLTNVLNTTIFITNM